MRNLLTYEAFLITESKRQFDEFIKIDGKRKLVEAISTSPFFTEDARLIAESLLEDNTYLYLFEDLNETSIYDRVVAKATAAAKTLKTKGKEYLSDAQELLLKVGGSIKGIISQIMTVIKAFLEKAWKYINEQVESGYAKIKEKVINSAKGKFKGQVDKAKEEVKNLSAMSKGTLKWCLGGFSGEAEGALDKASKIDESFYFAMENAFYIASSEMIVEDESFYNHLLEGDHGHHDGPSIPFLSSLAHKVASLEPFKSLHKIEHAAGDAANKGLSGISSFLSKVANAPGPFEFVVVGGIFALITGHLIKAGVTSLIKEIGISGIGAAVASTIPGLGVVLLSMKYTAKGIWCVGVCETAISLVAKGDDHKEKSEENEES